MKRIASVLTAIMFCLIGVCVGMVDVTPPNFSQNTLQAATIKSTMFDKDFMLPASPLTMLQSESTKISPEATVVHDTVCIPQFVDRPYIIVTAPEIETSSVTSETDVGTGQEEFVVPADSLQQDSISKKSPPDIPLPSVQMVITINDSVVYKSAVSNVQFGVSVMNDSVQ